MKVIILAAGEGTRLRPLTDDRPKCMVEFQGKPIINHILDTVARCDIDKTVIVGGYRFDKLKASLTDRPIIFYENFHYARTNMVATLFCAEEEMDDDLIISYADIVFSEAVLKALIDSEAGIGVVVDRQWRSLWETRMDNPLDDAETMKLDDHDRILELGQKASKYEDAEGQYIGLIKIRKDMLPRVRHLYGQLDRSCQYDGKDFDGMFMTSFLQLIIDRLSPIHAVLIDGGWLEIDTMDDLQAYRAANVGI